MPSNVLRTEAELPSSRLLVLPSTFQIIVWIYFPEVTMNSGGSNSSLSGFPQLQDGGEDDSLLFFAMVEDPA